MGEIASQITSLTIVYSTVYSDADQRKHQRSASLAFVRGIPRGPVNSPHKWPVMRKMCPFADVIMVNGFAKCPWANFSQFNYRITVKENHTLSNWKLIFRIQVSVSMQNTSIETLDDNVAVSVAHSWRVACVIWFIEYSHQTWQVIKFTKVSNGLTFGVTSITFKSEVITRKKKNKIK